MVTGSTRGIGKAIAVELADQGNLVVVHGRQLTDVILCVDEIRQRGGQAIGLAADLTDTKRARELVTKTVDHAKRLDILVNNAGMIRDRRFVNMTDDDWQTVLDVHLNAVFALTQEAVATMQKQHGGVIINMTSLAGLQGVVGQANYASAKAGILGFTWTLAKELADHHIRVNAISPAALTDMTRPYVEKAKRAAEKTRRTLAAVLGNWHAAGCS